MIGNPNREPDCATYAECISVTVRDLGTSTPHIQVAKLISWLYDVPVGSVMRDCQDVWGKIRSVENQGRGEPLRYDPRNITHK